MEHLVPWMSLLEQELAMCQPATAAATELLLQEFVEHLQQSFLRLRGLSLHDVQQLQSFVAKMWSFCLAQQPPETLLKETVYACGIVLVRWRRVALRKDKSVFWLDRFARNLAGWIGRNRWQRWKHK